MSDIKLWIRPEVMELGILPVIPTSKISLEVRRKKCFGISKIIKVYIYINFYLNNKNFIVNIFLITNVAFFI